jgi:hypothetical protein
MRFLFITSKLHGAFPTWFRFPTNQMSGFIELAKEKGMADTLSTVCATGGGAYKFEQVPARNQLS